MQTITTIFSNIAHSLEKLWDKDAFIISLVAGVVLAEVIAIFIKRSIKRRIFAIQKDTTDKENPEYYLEYYKK